MNQPKYHFIMKIIDDQPTTIDTYHYDQTRDTHAEHRFKELSDAHDNVRILTIDIINGELKIKKK